MSYQDLRGSIRSGDLLFFRERGFWPWLIRTATRSDYCHVGVAWVVAGRVMILEARARVGVSARMLSEALPVDWIATDCAWTPEIEEAALARLQTAYSFWDAIALGLGVRPTRAGLVCSLYAADVLAPWLARKGVAIPREGLTPGHLAELFLAAGGELRTLA